MNDKELLAHWRKCMKNLYSAVRDLNKASSALTVQLGFDFKSTWRAWDRFNEGPLRDDIKRGLDSLFKRKPELRASAKELELENWMM